MLIIPAIDLKDHKVVRLSQGMMDQSKVYSDDPVFMAGHWIDFGIKRIHLVDLNGAFEGSPVHFDVVEAIAKKYPVIEIEIGGGIRSMDTIERYFNAGARYCILGTVALKKPELLMEASAKYPGKIILGIDAKNGYVATEGWADVSQVKATDIVQKFATCAIESVIYTDIAKDGMLKGMSYDQIEIMANSSPFPIIGSGGLTSLDDIKRLKTMKNILGIIAGKALYEGKIDLKDAIQLVL